MSGTPLRPDRTGFLYFSAVFLLYLSLSPGSIGGMGYTMEEMNATIDLFSSPGAYLAGDESIRWSRNGPVPLLFHGPFMALGSVVSGGNPLWVDRMLAVQPVLFSALIVSILFAWIRRLTGSGQWAFVLSSVAAFATMLWPYAYIGLETTQSLFLVLAGWMALGSAPPRTWPKTILFALVCALAVSAKSTGAFLLPAVLFLIWRFDADPARFGPRRMAKPAVILLVVVFVFLLNAHYRGFFWAGYGGSTSFVKVWLVTGPISFILNLVNFLFSANKGLIVFAPVTLLSFYYLPRAWKTHRWIAIWALLALGGLAGGFSLMRNWADETWGPRYLHSTIAPLVLCIAAAHAHRPFRWKHQIAVALTAFFGVVVSFFGSFFYYGQLHAAQTATEQPILEALQTDPVWNHIRFNERLMRVWLASDESGERRTWWRAEHKWFFHAPAGAEPWKGVDLARYAVPQSSLVRTLEAEHRSPIDRFWLLPYLGSAILGAILFVWCGFAAARRGSGQISPGDPGARFPGPRGEPPRTDSAGTPAR